jgi:flavin-binding protein dodecin
MSRGKFTGTSKNGDIQEALANAIGAAKDGLKTDLVRWTLDEISGEDGGFVLVRDITVKINARTGSKTGGKK